MAAAPKTHDAMRKDVEIDMVERCEDSSTEDLTEVTKSTTMGTVTISDSSDTILVPTPSSDPRGNTQSCKLRIPWMRYTKNQYRSTQYATLEEEVAGIACLYLYDPTTVPVDIVNTSLVSAVGLSMVSGFGGLLGFYIPGYVESTSSTTLRAMCSQPKLTRCRRGSDLRRYYPLDDLPDDVYGSWQSYLHAACVGCGSPTSLPCLLSHSGLGRRTGCLLERL